MDIYKFLKFGIVGFSGLIVDFSFTWLCKEKFIINKYISNSIGFTLGVINNFYWNKNYTFNDYDSEYGIQFLKFLIVALVGFLLNNFILYLLQKRSPLNFYVSKVIVTIVVFFWNFFANSLYTFNNCEL
jgi:putative flippase GtrA